MSPPKAMPKSADKLILQDKPIEDFPIFSIGATT